MSGIAGGAGRAVAARVGSRRGVEGRTRRRPWGRLPDHPLRRALSLPWVGLLSLLGLLVVALPLHLGHDEALLDQRLPRPLMWLFTRYEHLGMRAIGYLAEREWMHSRPRVKRLVDRIGLGILTVIDGEVLTLREAGEVVGALADAGCTIAIGTCPCRRARNEFSDEVPNNTDMVVGPWADQYLDQYPGMYTRIDLPRALELLEDFERYGFVHQALGFDSTAGALTVICNCSPDVCIPLRALKDRGYPALRRGRSRAVVESASCLGVEECGECLARCAFGAREAAGGKGAVLADACFGCGMCASTCRGGATRLERLPGAELVYTSRLVGD